MRVPPTALLVALLAAPITAQLQFTEVSAALGVDVATFGRGAAMVDFDGDGLLDLATSNDRQPNRFFRQDPDHGFTDVTAAWGLAPDFTSRSWGMVAADFDNDGDPDVVFANGGFYEAQRSTVLRNDLDTAGVFTDVTALSGAFDGLERTHGVTALDYDRDGLLDLFFTSGDQAAGVEGRVKLLRNEGGLVFSDQSAAAGLTGLRGNFRHCGAGDFDNDGWPDLGAGDRDGGNLLLRNGQDGTFTDVAAQAGVASPARNFGFVFEDLDNDGWLDVYDPKYQAAGTENTISRAFINQQDGTFLDVSAYFGLAAQEDMGHNTGDLDLDGWPEIFTGTGSPGQKTFDVLRRIAPSGVGDLLTTTDLTFTSGLAAVGETRSHGSVMGDIDEDGDVDLYINSGGPANLAGTIEENYLYLNQGNANHWVKVGLTGVASNRMAVGARIQAVTASGREVWTSLQAGKGFGNTDSPIRQLGLGDEDELERIVVLWPSGLTQTRLAPEADTRHDLVETGILIEGSPQLGGAVVLRFVGPPGEQAELLLGLLPGSTPMKKFGGELALLPPFVGPIALSLGPSGQLALPAPIPDEPLLAGVPILLQAWVHAPEQTQGGTLTDPATLLIE